MHEQGLRELLQTPPYDSMSDADVAAALNATSTVVAAGPIQVTSRKLYGELGVSAAETILEKLEAASATNAMIKRVLHWLDPSEEGVDITNQITRNQVDALVAANVLTSGEGAAVKAIGEETVTYAQTLGLASAGDTVTAEQIASLR